MHSTRHEHAEARTCQRQHPRLEVSCRIDVRIGKRRYAGYLEDISRGGARLRTLTAIRQTGKVHLRLPDLEPVRCELRWNDQFNAGVSFEVDLSSTEIDRWTGTRLSCSPLKASMPRLKTLPLPSANAAASISDSGASRLAPENLNRLIEV